MNTYTKSILLALVAVLGVLPGTAFALTVSPARIEISGDPGTTITGEIELLNEQTGTRTFYSSMENFEPAGESGTPRFIGGDVGLATWIETTEQVDLDTEERVSLPFSITIPKDAEPGGHYAAIFWGSQPPTNQKGGQVSVGGKLGILVLLSVTGDITSGGDVSAFQTEKKARVFTTLPVQFTYRVENAGGDRIIPVGHVDIRNTFRMSTEKIEANREAGNVLSRSARKFTVVWNPEEVSTSTAFFSMVKRQWSDFHFGWYTAKLNVGWEGKVQASALSYHFFILPWQLLLILFLGLFGGGFVARKGLKAYNKFIIAQAKKG